MDRFFQALLIFSMASLSWLLMMALHESGHVLNGWISRARLSGVELPLLGFSRTDFSANPHPLFVAWGGAIWGCLLPLAILIVHRMTTKARVYLTAWLAGFCLIANGAYLFGGGLLSVGADDGGVILQNGGSRWQLLAFGAATIAGRLYCWSGLGPNFGLGASGGKVDRRDAVGAAVALLVVCMMLLLTNR